MITGAIGIFLIIIGVILAEEGQWGSAILAWVLAVVSIVCGVVSRDDDRARNNFDRYWRDGGESERRNAEYKRRKRDEKVQKALEERQAEIDRKVERIIAEKQAENAAKEVKANTIRCDGCGKSARVIRNVTYPSGAKYVEYKCPYCGARKLKKT